MYKFIICRDNECAKQIDIDYYLNRLEIMAGYVIIFKSSPSNWIWMSIHVVDSVVVNITIIAQSTISFLNIILSTVDEFEYLASLRKM